jgi:hypothetical protein
VIDRFLARRERRRRRFAPVTTLRASPRQVFASVARFALGRLPNERLLRGNSRLLIDPYDKQITRNDVRSYVRRVRHAVM